jgi:uncharacterized coiled-coil protein SlyX
VADVTPEALADGLEEAASWMATRPAGVTWTGDGLDGTVAGLRDAAKSIRGQLVPAHAALAAERDDLAAQVATLKGEPSLTEADLIAHALAAEEGHANGAVHDAFGCRPCLLQARARLAEMTGERDERLAEVSEQLAATQAHRDRLNRELATLTRQLNARERQLAEVRRIACQCGKDATFIWRELLACLEGING